jgi:hypothetical protein
MDLVAILEPGINVRIANISEETPYEFYMEKARTPELGTSAGGRPI